MTYQGILSRFKNVILFGYLLLFPLTLHASFIEATIGTAVVNDATATYYNPAALTLLKNSQIITLGSIAYFRSHFSGQAIQSNTGFTLTGSSNSRTHYFLPSFYLGIPVTNKLTVGIAIISNFFNRDLEDHSILRYAQSGNRIEDIDVVPAIGFKLNECLSVGAGLSISHARFLLEPLFGFPSLNIPDSQSRNRSSATSLGGHVGLFVKASKSTSIGFNYRSSVTYNLKGTSVFEGNRRIVSNNYRFKFWTPARSVFSINHFVTTSLGLIATIQYIQWNIINNINVHGIATPRGILNAKIPHHLHNSWLLTLGSHYRITPKWIARMAASYIQSPSTGHFQITNGDNFILGASMGYDINKHISIDGSYAHAFIKNRNIHIRRMNIINGVNRGSRDAVSLKLTLNA